MIAISFLRQSADSAKRTRAIGDDPPQGEDEDALHRIPQAKLYRSE
jgi:hypothetical protein